MGQFLRVRGHRRHRLTLIAHLFLRHDGLVGNKRPVEGGKIRTNDHSPDTGQCLGLFRVDTQNPGVGIGAVKNGAIELSWLVHIRTELGGTGDLGNTALADLRMSNDGFFTCGIFTADDQTVPVAAFLHHRMLLSSKSSSVNGAPPVLAK